MRHREYHSPLEDRYRGKYLSYIFSDDHRYTTWRWLWAILASAERECGINISEDQIREMEERVRDIPYSRVAEIERTTHHDVVSHLKAFAEQCPDAAPIIHLGATSSFITDNADTILMVEAMEVIERYLTTLVSQLAHTAKQYGSYPMVGRTHFQPAQPVTLGKRLAMWSQDFNIDLENLRYQKDHVYPLGCRGATGTAASFLDLFNGDGEKVKRLEEYLMEYMGFPRALYISGQTYTRKQDFYVLSTLSGIAQSASKFATDIRLLAGLGELSESFATGQVGSSAMPYKKNPITCEKICGLARYVIVNAQNPAITASTQWLERTLDDSSNRRIVIPEMFITTETILSECITVMNGLRINYDTIRENYENHKDSTLVEHILVEGTKRGGDRQKLYDKLKQYIDKGGSWYEDVANDPEFGLSDDDIETMKETVHVGMSQDQIDEYVSSL